MDDERPMAYCRKDMNLKHPAGECPHDQEERGVDEQQAGCDVNWGSHGCMHPRGHAADIPHECDCCRCGEHHPYPDWPDTRVSCVAKPPYYGPETHFYGADA